MAVYTFNCFLLSCKKEYIMDSAYHDKFRYCKGECYQKDFDETLPKVKSK